MKPSSNFYFRVDCYFKEQLYRGDTVAWWSYERRQ